VASFFQEYSAGLTVSVIAHALIVLMFAFNLFSMPSKEVPPVQLAIEATVIDMGAVRKKQEAEKRRQLEQERKKQAAAAERRKKAELQQREEKQRLTEKKRQQEAEAKRVADQKRKTEANKKTEQKRVAEQKKKAEAARVAEQKRKAEAARVAEQKRKEEAARVAEQKRQEAERQRKAEIQRQLQSEIAAEDDRLAAISSGKLQQYKAAIIARVTRNWVEPASAKAGIECEVLVKQIPGGDIVNVRVGRCNGDAAVVRSIEAAVYRASPLPPPPDPSLFERNLRFTFKPEE
jgi:colicin import membrane protein